MPLAMDLVELANKNGRSYVSKLSRDTLREMGQFLTPPSIARFMAARLMAGVDAPVVRLLEPSAGAGVLAAAALECLLKQDTKPHRIELLLYELDKGLVPLLKALCERAKAVCKTAGVELVYIIENTDFLLSELALSGQRIEGLITIANPPFLKLNASDNRAVAHGYAVFGQPNIYALFMAACARLTPPGGRWCFITPRSWMAGSYFRATRQVLLQHLTLDALHTFESRKDSFQEDAVLQETMICWAMGRNDAVAGSNIVLTRSKGTSDLAASALLALPVERVVSSCSQTMLSLPTEAADPFEGWTATLQTYGLKVSTGPVVAFRAKAYIRDHSGSKNVPLLWLQHVGQQRVLWPGRRDKECIEANAETSWMLVRNQPMVLMRRFSPKEDERRVTCAAYEGHLPGDVVGLENHLNYIYRPGSSMSVSEVRGLSALLASRLVDRHFRALAGSTQVNATELRQLPLPPLAVIERIGRALPPNPTLKAVDEAVESVLAVKSSAAA